MKHFLKGAAAVAIVMVPLIVIHIIFNMMGIDLNEYLNNVVETMLASGLATTIYHALLKNEKNKDGQE